MTKSAAPPWLDAGERRAWLALIGMFTLLPSALDSQLMRESGISSFEYLVMAVLSEQPDRTLQLKQLSGIANGSLSRLSHVITRLAHRGWVVRSQAPSNGRVKLATLTDEGYRKVVEAAPGHVAEVRRLVFDALSREQVAALEDVAATIGAALGAPAPPSFVPTGGAAHAPAG